MLQTIYKLVRFAPLSIHYPLFMPVFSFYDIIGFLSHVGCGEGNEPHQTINSHHAHTARSVYRHYFNAFVNCATAYRSPGRDLLADHSLNFRNRSILWQGHYWCTISRCPRINNLLRKRIWPANTIIFVAVKNHLPQVIRPPATGPSPWRATAALQNIDRHLPFKASVMHESV